MDNHVNPILLFNNRTLSASESIFNPNPISMEDLKLTGFFGFQFKFSGLGLITLSIVCSNDEDWQQTTALDYLGFTAPYTNSVIASSLSTGTYFFTPNEIQLPPCKWFKIKAAEVGATNGVTGIYGKMVGI